MSSRFLGISAYVWIAIVVGVVVLIGIPLSTDKFTTFEFANVAVYVIALMGLNLLTGYSGQISLGNGAFMAIGGYTTALTAYHLKHSFGIDSPAILYASIPLAALLAGLFGFLFGFPALRLSGIYLALATFALALSIPPIIDIDKLEFILQGHSGVNLHPLHPPDFLALSDEQWLYFVNWAIAGLMFVLAWNLVRSTTGRAFMAVRDSETAAVASGVSLSYYKTLAFGISAAYSGIAGSLLAISVAYVNPDVFGLQLSLALLVAAVIGGLGFEFGPLIGGLFFVWLPYWSEQVSKLHVGTFQLPSKPDVFYGVRYRCLPRAKGGGARRKDRDCAHGRRSRGGVDWRGAERDQQLSSGPGSVQVV
ncbi:MAG: branched-chain amino acid ABC transporter permease [Chloroflexi bacterium]|nr:MAG: branched-chain amino acid ABC transporter permease [Chloroflexota bacterium]